MNILVKGMKMPWNCIVCPMQFVGMCYVQQPEVDDPRVAHTTDQCVSRASWCPLVEIPDGHGRLIDADALKSYMEECKGENAMAIYATGYARGFIDKAPTIIPSDNDGEA